MNGGGMRIAGLIAMTLCIAGFAVADGVPDNVSYKLDKLDGRLVVSGSDGSRIPWTAFGCSSERSMDVWREKQTDFVEAGALIYQLTVWPSGRKNRYFDQPFWSHDGKPVETPDGKVTLGEQAEWLLEQVPDARFFIRFGVWPDPDWREANLEEFMPVPVTPGHTGQGGNKYSVNGSLASEKYLAGVDRIIRDTVAWCEKQPWQDRIIGYSVFPLGEGATEIATRGFFFDRSLPMIKRFRGFVRAKYADQDSLRAAWNNPDITFDAVTVPANEEWLEKRKNLFHFPDPAETVMERDYFECARLCFREYLTTMFDALADATSARPCLKGYDILKQHMQGWMLEPRFDAAWNDDTWHTHSAIMFVSGAFDVADLLDHPGIDILHTPGVYYNRSMGFAWEAEGISDTLTLRDKLNFMEGDMRTWVNFTARGKPTSAQVPDSGAFRNVEEARAGFDRAIAWAVSRNQMFYYMNVFFGNWWFHHPELAKAISDGHEIVEQSLELPFEETRDAVCMVIDDTSPMWEDFTAGYQQLAVRHQMQEGLSFCGIPYRVHLFEDIARADFPDYKVYLFPNLFMVDEEREALLRKKVLRNGNVAIFGPATGITDGLTRTAEPASRLLGVEMELIMKTAPRRTIFQNHGHPVSRALPVETFGSDYAFGPILTPKAIQLNPEEHGAYELGNTFMYYFFERPGLFIKDFGKGAAGNDTPGDRGEGDYAVVFSAAVPLPAGLLRELARYAGCNVWSEENVVVYANSRFVGVHTARGGRQTIHLPRLSNVIDMKTRKILAEGVREITLEMSAPETALLRLDPADEK